MKDTLVSILIPVYNSEKYIEETVKSAINQSWYNKEIIIVDDGSTDHSLNIIKKYESDYVKIFTQKNKGACAARNVAFSKSSGSYIQYLDADDLLSPTKIERQMNTLLKSEKDCISSCAWAKFKSSIHDAKFEYQKINKSYDKPINWLIDSWNGNGMAQTSVWLTPRSLIENAGQWNEDLRINQDGEFFSRIIVQVKKIIFCNDSIVYYRTGNKDSISNNMLRYPEDLLRSYKHYELNILPFYDNLSIRKSLIRNYSKYIYMFHDLHQELIKTANAYIIKLGGKHDNNVGGPFFNILTSIFGFHFTLKLRKQIFNWIKK